MAAALAAIGAGILTSIIFQYKGIIVYNHNPVCYNEASKRMGCYMKSEHSFKDIAYKNILDDIVKGKYGANQIINEKELSEQFGFSKSPIREALLSLCNEGVLRSLPRFGYEVVQLTKEDILETQHFRYVIEGSYLRESYQSITKEQLGQLYELNELCKSQIDDAWVHWEYNANFHLTLLSYAKNRYACKQLKNCLEVLRRAYVQLYRDKWGEEVISREYHDSMLKSIENRKLESALEFLKQELSDF